MSKLELNYKRIVLTGPESTGKTTLAKELAKQFNTEWIPEVAREYLKDIKGKYSYLDVVEIARIQLIQELEVDNLINEVVFFDTSLIITKVWLDLVFNKYPSWIDEQIKFEEADLYLLCAPDIEWVPDPLRENGGIKRHQLFERYLQELEHFGFNYRIITGEGEDRVASCSDYVIEELRKKKKRELLKEEH